MGILAKGVGVLADWLEAGYPEEVAKRIVSGELPMDEASRMARADAQGYGGVLYRGHDADMPPLSNEDMWMTSSPYDAETYALARGTQYTDGSIDGAGVVTPLRTNANYHGPNNLAYVRGDSKMYDRVTTNSIKNPGIRQGIITGTDDIAEAVRDSGQYQGTHFRDIKDEFHASSSTDPSDVYNILGSRPDVNIRHADAAYDPQYTGPNIMGGVLAGGVGLGALSQSEDADAGFITKGGKTLLEAWHGSPHKFDRFSMGQIGTGEGAQAYGHGLYFADSEDVARGYQHELAGFDELFTLDGKPYAYPENMPVELDPDAYHLAVQNAGRYGKDGAMEKAELMSGNGYSDEWIESYKKYVNEVGGRVEHSKVPNGALYRTEIDVTPESLLDWDKPLSEQSEAVRSAIESLDPLTRGLHQYAGEERAGRDFYWGLQAPFKSRSDAESFGISKEDYWLPDGERASKMLREAGVPGIKYLDGDSRAVGDGTSNYVIFDDSLINIAERGSATVPALGVLATGTGAALAAPALKSEGLEKATGFLDETIRSARHAAGPLSFLVPYEGISNFAKKWNADEDLTWQDYLGLLDF